jgi:hypothetical protein
MAVFAEDVCGLAAMFVEHPAVVLQPHPATEDQFAQTIARFLRERRRCCGSAAQLRRFDPEEPDAAVFRDGDGAAVGDRGHSHGFGSSRSRAERNGLSYCHGRNEHSRQNLHTHLRWRGDRATESHFCNRGTVAFLSMRGVRLQADLARSG